MVSASGVGRRVGYSEARMTPANVGEGDERNQGAGHDGPFAAATATRWNERATAVRGYFSTRYSDRHTAPRNAWTPTGGARLGGDRLPKRRPRIPGASIPISVPSTGVPAYCSGLSHDDDLSTRR